MTAAFEAAKTALTAATPLVSPSSGAGLSLASDILTLKLGRCFSNYRKGRKAMAFVILLFAS
jgi:hypothetical protein